jgi:hypothetical protein
MGRAEARAPGTPADRFMRPTVASEMLVTSCDRNGKPADSSSAAFSHLPGDPCPSYESSISQPPEIIPSPLIAAVANAFASHSNSHSRRCGVPDGIPVSAAGFHFTPRLYCKSGVVPPIISTSLNFLLFTLS